MFDASSFLRQVLKRCESHHSAGCHREERHALQGLAHSARGAADAVGHVSALGRVVKRRSYPILDGSNEADPKRERILAMRHPIWQQQFHSMSFNVTDV